MNLPSSLAVLVLLSIGQTAFPQGSGRPTSPELPPDLPSSTIPDSQRIELHRAADEHLLAGRYKEAQLAFARALAATPEDPTLRYGLACALSQLGKIDEAYGALEAAVNGGYGDPLLAYPDPDLQQLRSKKQLRELIPRVAVKRGSSAKAWTFGCLDHDYALIPGNPVRVAYARGDGSLAILDGASQESLVSTDPRPSPIASMGVNESGTEVALLFADGAMETVDPNTGASKALEPATGVERAYWVSPLQFAAEGRYIVAWTSAGAFSWSRKGAFLGAAAPLLEGARWRSCDLSHSAWIPQLKGPTLRLDPLGDKAAEGREIAFPQNLASVEFSPDGAMIAVGAENGALYLLDAATGEIAWSQTMTDSATGSPVDLFGTPLKVATLAFDPDGKRLAVCTTTGYFVGVFDVATGEQLWRTGHLGGRMGGAMSLVLGREVLLGDEARLAWDAKEGRGIWAPEPARKLGHGFAVRGRRIYFGDADELRCLDIESVEVEWRTQRSRRTPHLMRHPSGWVSGSFHPADEAVEASAYDPKRLRLSRLGLPLSSPR